MDAPLKVRQVEIKKKEDEILDIRTVIIQLKMVLTNIKNFFAEQPAHPLTRILLRFENELWSNFSVLRTFFPKEAADFDYCPAVLPQEKALLNHVLLGDLDAKSSIRLLEDKVNRYQLPLQRSFDITTRLCSVREFRQLGSEINDSVVAVIANLNFILPKLPFQLPVWNPLLSRNQENLIDDFKDDLEEAMCLVAPTLQNLEENGITLEEVSAKLPEINPHLIRASWYLKNAFAKQTTSSSPSGLLFPKIITTPAGDAVLTNVNHYNSF